MPGELEAHLLVGGNLAEHGVAALNEPVVGGHDAAYDDVAVSAGLHTHPLAVVGTVGFVGVVEPDSSAAGRGVGIAVDKSGFGLVEVAVAPRFGVFGNGFVERPFRDDVEVDCRLDYRDGIVLATYCHGYVGLHLLGSAVGWECHRHVGLTVA